MGFTPEQIKGRIKSVAKQNNADARTLMRIYMMERFLERLAQSEYRDNFIIKGGILVTAMIGVAHRSTMDIDTSMKNLNLSAEDALRVVNQVKDIDLDDGVSFEVKDVSNIMDEMEYTLNKISFDYAVVEHEPEIEVMRFAGTWKDLGTWNTLTEAMDSHAVGEALFNEKCENVHVVNELDVPILCMGLKDVVVSASPEGILVSDKEQSSYIKSYVNTLDHRVMFAEKSWGSFKVIDIDKASMAIKVTLNAGHQMNYHSHQHRDEVWTVIAGKGKTIVDGMEQNVKAGDVITMSAGCRHTVIAETELKLIEVQLGEAIDVHDKQKFELEY